MKILNFGSCNIDSVYDVDHIVMPGETIMTHSLKQYPGGKGLNQSVALARAGAKVYHAGCVGEDGHILLHFLKDNHVNMEYVCTVEQKTGQAIIQVDKNGENSIFLYTGANGAVTKEFIDEVLLHFDAGDFLLLQNEINNIPYLIKQAVRKGLKIVLNPSPITSVMQEIDLNDITFLILNEVEAGCFHDIQNPNEFIAWIAKNYPQLHVVLTLGKNGCIYTNQNTIFRHPAFKVSSVDTTAAGDTFTGYFVASLCKGFDIKMAIGQASAAAAIATTRKGAAPSIPTIQELEAVYPTMQSHENDQVEENINIIYHYIDHHYVDATLKGIAEVLHYTPAYASRWIVNNMGTTFSELLQSHRCKVAADYLVNTDLPVADIIKQIGYNNESFFRTIFLKRFNMLPLEYRKRNK